MGSLYWQLNDCWPVASWASIDYYGRWKALHYGAKRFYARFMASACEEEELSTKIAYYVHNESFQNRKAALEISLIDKDFAVLHQEWVDTENQAFETKAVKNVDFSEWIEDEEQRRRVFARYRLIEEGQYVSTGITMFVKPKYFQYSIPQYEVQVREDSERFYLRVKADTFANYVELYLTEADCVFSDNYFDITEKEGVEVTVEKSQLPSGFTAEEIKRQLRIKSVAESY